MNQQEANHSQIELKKAQHFANFKNGVSWFFWVAVISVINIVIRISNADSPIRFAVGFSITNWLDAHPLPILANASPRVITIVVGFAFAIVLIVFGLIARKRNRVAYLAGTLLYALDTVIAFLMRDVYAIVFHLIVLGFLAWGIINLFKLEKLEAEFPNKTEPDEIVIGPDKA
ncbi:MAG TPA: hypothetical protein PLW19_01235 [Anaerolineaceae bacterium]|nr:hypothetical protein [Anaerolineaceae bacterium]